MWLVWSPIPLLSHDNTWEGKGQEGFHVCVYVHLCLRHLTQVPMDVVFFFLPLATHMKVV